jgi:mono/diheme cytochrome c family protein
MGVGGLELKDGLVPAASIAHEGTFPPDQPWANESDMPAFAGVLSDEEIRAVLAFIRSTWPEKEREYQAARTKAQ